MFDFANFIQEFKKNINPILVSFISGINKLTQFLSKPFKIVLSKILKLFSLCAEFIDANLLHPIKKVLSHIIKKTVSYIFKLIYKIIINPIFKITKIIGKYVIIPTAIFTKRLIISLFKILKPVLVFLYTKLKILNKLLYKGLELVFVFMFKHVFKPLASVIGFILDILNKYLFEPLIDMLIVLLEFIARIAKVFYDYLMLKPAIFIWKILKFIFYVIIFILTLGAPLWYKKNRPK